MTGNKKQKVYRIIMLITVVAIVTYVITTIINYDSSRKYIILADKDTSISQKIETSINAITNILNEKYIGNIDKDTLVEGALKGMVESVGDVYTEYYSKKELENFTASTLGNYIGIGVYMQSDIENDVIVIIAPIKDSPAEKAGLKTGDKIIKVDGVEYKARQIEELSAKVKGEEGTDVVLTISREDETFDITLTRQNIHINYVNGKMLEDNIGYISISTFDEGCSKDFINAYNELVNSGANKLIIDVRNNGGGLVNEALKIADLICEKNQNTLITVDKDGNEEIAKSKNNPTITMPIVVLTNKGSASASEILVAALKDNGKAEIVGEKTYGKGVIQELVYLSNGGAIKVTSAEYYTPNREKINKVGIEPDYTVSSTEEQLKKAIELLKEK